MGRNLSGLVGARSACATFVYTRDTTGRITAVQSRKISTDPWSNVATGIIYQPISRLVQSFTAGNGLSNWNTYTTDYQLDLSGVYNGATKLIERTHTRTDNLNLTNIGTLCFALRMPTRIRAPHGA